MPTPRARSEQHLAQLHLAELEQRRAAAQADIDAATLATTTPMALLESLALRTLLDRELGRLRQTLTPTT